MSKTKIVVFKLKELLLTATLVLFGVAILFLVVALVSLDKETDGHPILDLTIREGYKLKISCKSQILDSMLNGILINIQSVSIVV